VIVLPILSAPDQARAAVINHSGGASQNKGCPSWDEVSILKVDPASRDETGETKQSRQSPARHRIVLQLHQIVFTKAEA
jgi:hypothetical protein